MVIFTAVSSLLIFFFCGSSFLLEQKRLLKTEMGQTAMTLEPAESEECGWADLSQYLSFPSDGTSADQVRFQTLVYFEDERADKLR